MKFKLYKKEVDHEFVIEIVEKDTYIKVFVDKKYTTFKDDRIEFIPDMRINGQRIKSISLPENIKNEIIKASDKARERSEQEERERKADRPAPFVDTEKYFVYSYGCDTGLIYPREYSSAIQNILKTTKGELVFRGSRDDLRKFPGNYDNLIPRSYVTTTKKKEEIAGEICEFPEHSAPGYKHVWSESHCLPRQLVELEQIRLKEEKEKQRIEKEKVAQEKKDKIFELARTTNQVQVLQEWSEECDDPREECNVDNITVYARPDGSTETVRNHTW